MKYYLILLMLCFSMQSYPQKGAFELSVGAGFSFLKSCDYLASPLEYKGHGFPLLGSLNYNAASNRHTLSISLLSSLLTNAYPMESQTGSALLAWTNSRISYRYEHELCKQIWGWTQYFGGGSQAQIFYREYDYLDGHSWDAYLDLFLSYKIVQSFGKVTTAFRLESSLMSYLHRPPYTWDEIFLEDLFRNKGLLRHGSIAFLIRDYVRFQSSVKIDYAVTERLRFGVLLSYMIFSDSLIIENRFSETNIELSITHAL